MEKKVSGINKKHKGVFVVELFVGLTVLGILIACLAVSLYGYAKFNRYQLVRQQCIAAGQAQLESLTATGQQVSQDDMKRLWPKIDVTIEQSEGTGQWSDLQLVCAKTKGMSFDKQIDVELSRYIAIPAIQEE